MTTPTVRQAKVLRLLFMMRVILAEPKTLKDIATMLNVHERSVFRYFELLKTLGVEVKTKNKLTDKAYKITYYIDQCPCCGRKKGEA